MLCDPLLNDDNNKKNDTTVKVVFKFILRMEWRKVQFHS